MIDAKHHAVVSYNTTHMCHQMSICDGVLSALPAVSCRAMRRSESMHKRMKQLVVQAKMLTEHNSKRQELVGIRCAAAAAAAESSGCHSCSADNCRSSAQIVHSHCACAEVRMQSQTI
jgi:hypothetical protein